MCFSAEADIVGGLVVGAIGLDVLRHIEGRREYVALGALPLLFAVHQIDEALVWWGLEGRVPSEVGTVATWIYLLFAFVVLPVYVPIAISLLEPSWPRRLWMLPFLLLGVAVSIVLFAAMLRGPVAAQLHDHFVGYSTDLHAGGLVVLAYVLSTCGALILSGDRNVALFGIVNLLAVTALAWLTVDGFASLWCAWAAVVSGLLAFHLRQPRSAPSSARLFRW